MENINKIDLDEYNVRLSLSTEEKLDNKTISNLLNILNDDKTIKTFRLKNRYYIETPDKMFRFDLTSIKMSEGISFKKSNVFEKPVEYEIELEYIHNDKQSNKDIFEGLFKNINILLMLYHNNDIIIKDQFS